MTTPDLQAATDAVAALGRSGAWPPGQHAQEIAKAAITAADRVRAGCTCLHPDWPNTPCALHPASRPHTQEQRIAFRKRWDERVHEGRDAS